MGAVSEPEPDPDDVAVLSLPIPAMGLGMLVDALEVAYGKDLRVRGDGAGRLIVFRAP